MRLKHSNYYQVLKLIDWDTHPIKVVEDIINRYGTRIKLEFSRYKYIPQTIDDDRKTFHIKGSDFSKEYISNIVSSLSIGEELAIHSKVIIEGEIKHIPMIDLSAKSTARAIKGLKLLLPKNIADEIVFYNSGRSFHAYSTCLMDADSFSSFLGRLLLSNNPGEPLLVDSRWVGHRLVGGYLSLRWSCNSNFYIQHPKKDIDFIGSGKFNKPRANKEN